MAETHHHAITIALDSEEQESRRRNLRSALRELSELRARRVTPVPMVHQQMHSEPLPAGRRRLFTFAARARSAVDQHELHEHPPVQAPSVATMHGDKARS